MSDLSHVDESTGDVHMVDVGDKPLSRRRAVARGRVRMAAATAERLRALPKGDALAVARIAGIQGAKRTSDLVPLCHPLPLTLVEVSLAVDGDGVAIEAAAETTAGETPCALNTTWAPAGTSSTSSTKMAPLASSSVTTCTLCTICLRT